MASEVRLNAGYFPVPIDSLESDTLELDIYIIHGGGKALLYRAKGAQYSNSDYKNLYDQGITHFYIPLSDHQQFQSMISDRLVNAYDNKDLGIAERTRIVRESCGRMIEDFMRDPSTDGLSDTIGKMASQFTKWCNEDESKFSHLLDMSEHDYYTTTHMVNVGVGCGLLGTELLGADHPMVRDLMLGGLVHDVGKRDVPAEVLNKNGKPTDKEWAMIRKHPEVGAQILRKQDGQSLITIDMTLNHHERLDGKGYPNGINLDNISLPAKICSVVDIYDAMTSTRAYRDPIPPRTVLNSMRNEVGSAIDREAFSAWERVIERMLTEDPMRAVPDDPSIATPALSDMSQVPESVSKSYAQALMIRRQSGELLNANLIKIINDEAIVQTNARHTRSEQVQLCFNDSRDLPATYLSTRINDKGEQYCVFKIADHKKAG